MPLILALLALIAVGFALPGTAVAERGHDDHHAPDPTPLPLLGASLPGAIALVGAVARKRRNRTPG